MVGEKKILAVVPARGGSKGIPLKNLKTIEGRPLVALVGDVVKEVTEIDRAIVSTDHEGIAQVAVSAGLDAPFRRPEAISGDRVGDWEVLTDALLSIERLDQAQYDIVVMLQPTSPLREGRHVSEAIKIFVDGGYDALWSVSETDTKSHPYKQLKIEDGLLDYWDQRGKQVIARQQLSPVYHRNGVVYVISRDCLLSQKTIKGIRTGYYITDGVQISIDTEYDIFLVEKHLEYIKKQKSQT